MWTSDLQNYHLYNKSEQITHIVTRKLFFSPIEMEKLIIDEQIGKWFSLVRGSGIEGYIVGNEYIKVAVPINTNILEQYHFCNTCRELQAPYSRCGYVLTELNVAGSPVVYPITQSTCFSVRCYRVLVERILKKDKYEITITGLDSTS